jgi:HEAT repeat protein
LGCFGDERSAEFLVRLVEEDGNGAGVAAYALAKREDYRGIPPLIRKLLSKEPRDQHTGNTAARLIAEFGQPGFLALQPLVTHSDVEVRRRASVGVFDIACLAKDTQLKREACELLEQCFQKETDAVLHQSLAACVRVVCKKNLGSTENPFSAPS